jgi:hypothetical protein
MTLPPSGSRPVDSCTRGGTAPAVEQALAALDGLADRPLVEHVAVFEHLHATLQDALAAGEAAGPA